LFLQTLQRFTKKQGILRPSGRVLPANENHQVRPFALFRESIVFPKRAGILAYNISAVLPNHCLAVSGHCRPKLSCYLQLRDSPWFAHGSLL